MNMNMKMIRKKGIGLTLIFLMFLATPSCDIFDLDINTDPNNPSTADNDLLMANAMLNATTTFAGGLNNMASGFMGITTSSDDFNFNNSSWNGTWNYLYSDPLYDLEQIIVSAEASGTAPRALGIAQVMKAYYFSLMVDLWGDVPYSEAFQGASGIKKPVYDDDEAIYADLISLCDQAVANFALDNPVAVKGDIIYNGSATSWLRAAKSLKLRLLIQTAKKNNNTAAIQAVVDAGGLITAASHDFQFRFAKSQNPDNRHPWYRNGYAGGEAGFSYYGHKFMYEMMVNGDPRTPFYFKRQTKVQLDPADPSQKQTIPCSQRDDCVYGYFVASDAICQALFNNNSVDITAKQRAYLAGFFGRDRADPSGIPNDNPIRTTVGAYPAAGLFDDVAETGGGNKGSGDGIFPMISSWMVNFYLLEAQISYGVTTGKTDVQLLRDALTQQFAKVFAVGTAADPQASADVATWPATYSEWAITYKTTATMINEIVAGYPAAGTEGQKLQYVMKQAWFANYGNGFEQYNAFRRTGYPNDLQEPLELPRQYALRLPYALDELNLNNNTPDVVYDSPTDAVWWDVIKFQF